jgi:hypothetical protein
VGTPKDDAYRLEHSRRDLIDFGLAEPKQGPLNWVIVVAIVALLVLGCVALVLFAWGQLS